MLERLQDQRLRFAELGAQTEGLAQRVNGPENKNRLLGIAMSAYRNAGDLPAELRVSGQPGSQIGLDAQDVRALAAADPAQLLQIARAASPNARNRAMRGWPCKRLRRAGKACRTYGWTP
jgi:hypothetical protein